MKTLTDFINESLLVNEGKKEAKCVKAWADYAKSSFKGDKDTLDKFIANLEYFATQDDKEWREMKRSGQLEDFLCVEVWDGEWFDDDEYDDLDDLRLFWNGTYKEYFDI